MRNCIAVSDMSNSPPQDSYAEHFAASALYVVATPLGNLGDITLRALACLRAADAIACEDTRHSRPLLDHFGIGAPCFALHEHNENEASAKLLALLGEGKRVALITDAGTPGISDPGARAAAAVHAAGFRVVPIPGANAAVALLSAAGLVEGRFLFAGFLPVKSAARRTAIEGLRALSATLVFYEAPHRIAETVADLAAVLEAERTLVIGRELTKRFEEIARLPLGTASAWLQADANRVRGEFVLAVSGAPETEGLDVDSDRMLRILLRELPTKQAAKLAAELSGQSKNALYARALTLREE